MHGSEDGSCHSNNPSPKKKSIANIENKKLLSSGPSEIALSGSNSVNQQEVTGDHDSDGYCEGVGYTTGIVPGAISSLQ